MLRQSVRLRKEYLVRHAHLEQENALRVKKARIKDCVEEGKPLAPEDRDLELQLRGRLDLQDAQALAPIDMDDAYAFAGTRDPRILLTTARDPSSRLLQFVKELKLMIPGADRINRGKTVIRELVDMAKANDVTDIMIVHEHRGIPDGLVVCHMPLGPTVYFTLEDVKLRHDLDEAPGPMPTSPPHLVFDNMSSKLGKRIQDTLKFLFPPPSPHTQRVVAFVNRGDRILVRHYQWADERHAAIRSQRQKEKLESASALPASGETPGPPETIAGDDAHRKARIASSEEKSLLGIELKEVGPRFVVKPYRIELGTIDMKNLEVEWALRTFINKPKPQLS